MSDFWVCPQCKSLNREKETRCYSCHHKLGDKVPEQPVSSPIVAGAGAPPVRPPSPALPASPVLPPMAPPVRPAAQPFAQPATYPQPAAPYTQPSPYAQPAAPYAQPVAQPAVPAANAAAAQVRTAPAPFVAPAAAQSVSQPAAQPAGRRGFGLRLPGRRHSDAATAAAVAGAAGVAAVPGSVAYGAPSSSAYSPAVPPAVSAYSPSAYSPSANSARVAVPAYPAAAPVGRRRIGGWRLRSLDPRPAFADRGAYYSVVRLGFFTAVLLAGVVALWLLTAIAFGGVAAQAVKDGSLASAWPKIVDAHDLAPKLAAALAIFGAVTLLSFSIVIAVATHNAPSLGAEAAILTPKRALRAWLNVLWAQARIGAGFIVPVYLFTIGWGIAGGIVALVVLEKTQRNLDDIWGWLLRPSRHLVDLVDKLALKGARSRVVGAWKVSFIAANLLAIVCWSLPLAVAVAGEAGPFLHTWNPQLTSSETLLTGSRLAAMVLFWAFVAASALAIGLLIPVTIDLVRREHTRRGLVLAGLTRPWMQPGMGGAAGQQRSAPTYIVPEEPSYDAPPVPYSVPAPEARPVYAEPPAAEALPADPGEASSAPGVPAWRQRATAPTQPASFAGYLERLKAEQRRAETEHPAEQPRAADADAGAPQTAARDTAE